MFFLTMFLPERSVVICRLRLLLLRSFIWSCEACSHFSSTVRRDKNIESALQKWRLMFWLFLQTTINLRMEFRMLKDPLNTLCDVRGFKTLKFYWCGRSLERPTLSRCYVAQWFRISWNQDVSTGPLAWPLARCSHRSLIRLLRTARFARALRCGHSFVRSLTHSLPSSWEWDLIYVYKLDTRTGVQCSNHVFHDAAQGLHPTDV